MKKILSIVLTLVLIMTLITGCSLLGVLQNIQDGPNTAPKDNDSGTNDSIDDDDSTPLDWPTADFPSGFPAYPDGVITTVDRDGLGTYVTITGTDRKTYDAYVKTLEAAGWAFEDPVGEEDVAKKGNLMLVMVFGGDGLNMMIGENTSEEPLEWPTADFSSGFPAYPGGTVVSIEKDDKSLFVYVTGTDKNTYNAYVKSLEAAGWIFQDGDEETDLAIKAPLLLVLAFDGDGVGISVNDEIGFVDDGNNKWPQDLPFELPVYPDGTIDSAWTSSDGNIYITITNTSRASYGKYLDMVENAGWEFIRKASDKSANAAHKDGYDMMVSINDDETKVDILIYLA